MSIQNLGEFQRVLTRWPGMFRQSSALPFWHGHQPTDIAAVFESRLKAANS
jgi:hypothetical protein